MDSEYESYKTHIRIVRDKAAHAAKGKPAGLILYGHIREYDPHTKRYIRTVINEEKASVIRDAAKKIANGHSVRSICNDLNDRNVPTPRGGTEWRHKTLKWLLTNPGYIAKRIHRGEVVGDADWPAILDEQTFYTVKRILSDPSRQTARDFSIKHLLSGILQCGKCGSPMYVKKNAGIPSYICRDARCTSLAKTKVNDFVERVVIERLSRKDFQDALRQAASGDDTDDFAAEINAKKSQLDDYRAAHMANKLSLESFIMFETKLLSEIKALEDQCSKPYKSPLLDKLVRAGTKEAMRKLWDEKFTVEQQREVLRILPWTFKLMPASNGRHTPIQDRIKIK